MWKYVIVRRMIVFLERSIYEGTTWVVFEPNDARLWACVADAVRLFLRAQWQAAALFGRTDEQALFVTCDETVMSQDDILNGQLIRQIGIAPVRPAEFVVFRIFQHAAEAQRQGVMACIDSLQNFRLRLEIDNIARAGLSEFASGETTIDAIEIREGTDFGSFEKITGLTKCGSITLKSGLTAGANLLDPSEWRNDVSPGQNMENRMKVVVVIQDESGRS